MATKETSHKNSFPSRLLLLIEIVFIVVYVAAVIPSLAHAPAFLIASLLLLPISVFLIWFSYVRSKLAFRLIGILTVIILDCLFIYFIMPSPDAITLGYASVVTAVSFPKIRILIGLVCTVIITLISLLRGRYTK